jgi:hypothetical protein
VDAKYNVNSQIELTMEYSILALAPMATPAASPAPTPDHNKLRKLVVVNFEDDGIVYCVDDNDVVYDTEDVFYDVRPARVIGLRVDGKFVPNPRTTTSASTMSTASDTIPSSGAASATASS